MRFSAVVMAGGRSRRMGRDKASLPAPPHRTLLERQLAVLSATAPCELLVAAREGQALPSTTLLRSGQVVRDDGLAGPLGGLVCVLRAMRSPWALVVAVDAVGVNPWILRRLLGAASPAEEHIGVIARTVAAPQPLVALWPRAMLSRAEAQLGTARDFSLRTLVAQGIADGLLRWLDVPPWDEPRFANWNCRSEVRATARWA